MIILHLHKDIPRSVAKYGLIVPFSDNCMKHTWNGICYFYKLSVFERKSIGTVVPNKLLC